MRDPFGISNDLVFSTLSPLLVRVNHQDFAGRPNQESTSHIGIDRQGAETACENGKLGVQAYLRRIRQILRKHLPNLCLEIWHANRTYTII